MRRKLVVTLTGTVPVAQAAIRRKAIAQQTGIPEEDVVVIDSATSLTLLPGDPDQDKVDTILRVLEDNRARLRRGELDKVAATLAGLFD